MQETEDCNEEVIEVTPPNLEQEELENAKNARFLFQFFVWGFIAIVVLTFLARK